MKNRILIEVCCGSVEDAVNAAQAGANRVELNSALILGGLTPSIGELSAVKERIGIPVICMVRPRGGGFCYTELEFETMKRDAAALIKEGADGIAFGFLNQDGGLDIDRTARFIETVCPGEAVFHRAFDSMTGSQADAIDKLAAAGVKRILTSG
ncbi:MAG: copper homeostasis protein CutC, partial [Oscillospiraceae bacterium]